LARALFEVGVLFASQATVPIRDALVRLNGRVRRDPETPVDLRRDKIAVSERSVWRRRAFRLPDAE